MTYEELDRQARAIGAWLESLDLVGQRALLLYPAGLDFIAGFFGCLYAGVVAVPVYPPRRNRSLERIQAIADDAEAKVALTTDTVLSRIEAPDRRDAAPEGAFLAGHLPPARGAGRAVAVARHPRRHAGLPAIHVGIDGHAQGRGPQPRQPGAQFGVDRPCLRAHAVEHGGVLAAQLPRHGPDRRHLAAALRRAAQRADVADDLSAEALIAGCRRSRDSAATTSGGPNFAYDLCVQKITPEQRKTLDLSRWKVAFNGAEPVRAETLDRFAETFAPCGFRREAFYPCYGLAEATLIVSGGYVAKPPVVRDFQSPGPRQRPGRARRPGRAGGRTLVGCGETLPDQKIVIADPETAHHLPARPDRRDLGPRPERRPGLLAAAGSDRGHVPRLLEGQRRRAVPAHRRPGIHRRTANCSSPAGSRT